MVFQIYPGTQLPPIILLDHFHQSRLQFLSSEKSRRSQNINSVLMKSSTGDLLKNNSIA